ncbi:MAG: D-tyrosyl-tRNA(Tyr) deacylase [Elusimicrobia bacterium CG11_big_fil_rev_8_21_14_0_20_64_6]|nr:MAG: D-tyrosyl-tRNA(Tyr) deacylase [Elusimicrobia bacterium CG11_big_fil_rev_8_21_14_0_20_64_6]
MKAVATRVLSASVSLRDGACSGERRAIGAGLLVLLGVGQEDDEAAAKKIVDKLLALRIFPNEEGKFDRSVLDVKGEILLISQFTLLASLKGGRRPDFTDAARPDQAEPLYRHAAGLLSAAGLTVRTGEFGASMAVESVNDGPVTIVLDTFLF